MSRGRNTARSASVFVSTSASAPLFFPMTLIVMLENDLPDTHDPRAVLEADESRKTIRCKLLVTINSNMTNLVARRRPQRDILASCHPYRMIRPGERGR